MVSDDQSSGQEDAALGPLLREYLEAAEGEILERADRAGSSAEQNVCFELLGELRHRGEGIVESFFANRQPPVDALPVDAADGESEAAAGGEYGDLRLFRDAVVNRAKSRGADAPENLCDRFLHAVLEHGVDVDGGITLLEIFERQVLERMDRSENGGRGEGSDLWDRGQLADALDDQLLRGLGRFEAWHGACGRPELSGESCIGQRSLLWLLAGLRNLATDAATSNLSAELLMNSLHQKVVETTTGSSLHPLDAQVIFLVLCRLQRLYGDPDLDPAARAQLGRLCMPLVTCGLVDHRVLLDPGHPARQLVNELSGTMLGWKDLGDLRGAATWRKVDAIITGLCAQDPADITRFTDFLVEWRVFRRRRRQRLERLGFGVRRAIADSQRTDDARVQAMASVREHLMGHEVPEQVIELAAGAWGDVLFHNCLEHGLDSEQWDHAITVLDTLLASVQRDTDRAARPRILGSLPILLKQLREGLREIGMEVAEVDHLLSALQQVHGCLLFSSGAIEALTWVRVDEEVFSRVRGRDADFDRPPWPDDEVTGSVTVVPDAWLEFSPPLEGTARFRVYGVEESLHMAILVNGANLVIREIDLAELGERILAGQIRMLDRTPVLERALATA